MANSFPWFGSIEQCSLGQSSHELGSQGSGYLNYTWQGVQDHPIIAGGLVVGALILAKLIHYYSSDSITMPRVFIHDDQTFQMSPWAREICTMGIEQLQSLSDEQFDAIIDHNDLEQINTEALGRIIDEQSRRAQAKGLI